MTAVNAGRGDVSLGYGVTVTFEVAVFPRESVTWTTSMTPPPVAPAV